MAIRKREGRACPWQVYWNNPFTGKRECANFATKEEARKEDSLVKHRLKFDRESFKKEEEQEAEQPEELTLEQAYWLYLREKQFSKTSLSAQLSSMRLIMERLGKIHLSEISFDMLKDMADKMKALPVKLVTTRNRLSILRTVLRWSADKGYCQSLRFPKLPPAQYEKFIPPTPEELVAIMAAAPEHIRRVVILGSQCGIRVGESELLKLQWTDIATHS